MRKSKTERASTRESDEDATLTRSEPSRAPSSRAPSSSPPLFSATPRCLKCSCSASSTRRRNATRRPSLAVLSSTLSGYLCTISPGVFSATMAEPCVSIVSQHSATILDDM